MTMFSESPHKPGSVEDMTFRTAEAALKNDRESGKGVEAISLGLAHVLRGIFKLPVFLFRGLRRVFTLGPVTRWTVIGALLGCVFGLYLSLSSHDEILRAQVRTVPLGAVIGLVLGCIRSALARPKRSGGRSK
jgi:hypothetical protein